MKIAIIGSGYFGSTIALILSKKHNVDLYEKEKDILNGASKVNQFRFHLGFHYPRSPKTINEINLSQKLFKRFFSNKVFGNTKNYYAIANENSKTSFLKYLKFLKKFKLNHQIIKKNKYKKISNLILTKEKILNYFIIKKILKKKLGESNVNLLLKKKFNKKYLNLYDKIIVCGYSQNNKILKELGFGKNINQYRYELIEKIIIKLPKQYKNKSYVVMDGNFVCVDPYLGTKYHLLSDVKFSKIEIIKKKSLDFRSNKIKYVNNKINNNIKNSNFKKFIHNSSKYLPFLNDAKYIGSFFTIRTLKQNVEKTDERTGEIQIINDKIISIFSSKWNTCIYVAKKLNKLLK